MKLVQEFYSPIIFDSEQYALVALIKLISIVKTPYLRQTTCLAWAGVGEIPPPVWVGYDWGPGLRYWRTLHWTLNPSSGGARKFR